MANQAGDPNIIDVPKDKVGETVQGLVVTGATKLDVEQKDPSTFSIRVRA